MPFAYRPIYSINPYIPTHTHFAIRAFRAQFEMRLHFVYRVRSIVVRVSMIKRGCCIALIYHRARLGYLFFEFLFLQQTSTARTDVSYKSVGHT